MTRFFALNAALMISVLLGSLAYAEQVPADTALVSEVERLDVDNTCTSDVQLKMAVQSLKWFKLYKKEDIDGVMDLFANDFKVYHSALVRFAVLNPAYAKVLRWSADPVTRLNYRGVLSQLVNGEDQSQRGDKPLKITCDSRNNVVVNANFRGYKVTRDPSTGCITHRAKYGARVTKTFVFDPTTLKITINYIDFDGNLADIARAKLAKMASDPVIPIVAATCRTAAATDAQYGFVPAVP